MAARSDAAPPSPRDSHEVRHLILGTAGHIDHGKSTLIRALTGTDPDRLPEEQRRGMTIELGFAALDLGDARFGVVDVPGHERFVRTMVSGATGIDLALLVIAADDSVMPQTIEHLEILDLLGVRKGVVALTKIDAVEPSLIELVEEEIQELLSGTGLEGAPVIPVSSLTGEGLDRLRDTLRGIAFDLPVASNFPPFRMAVDRVFTVQGRGTVVTGSVQHGRTDVGQTLVVWPGGHEVKIRGLQSHGQTSESVERGQRAAVNVIGVEREVLERGVELVTPGYFQPSHLLDVEIRCARSAPRPLKSARVVRLGLGTTEANARVILYDRQEIDPGETAFAQLRCGQPLICSFGQRFILRDENASATLGGGRVLRPAARRRRRGTEEENENLRRLAEGDPASRLEIVLRDAGFAFPSEPILSVRAGLEPNEVQPLFEQLEQGSRLLRLAGTESRYVPAALDDLIARLTNWLERYHRQHPELPGRKSAAVVGWLERMTSPQLAKPLFEAILQRRVVRPFGEFVCLPAFAPSLSAAEEKALREMVKQIREGGFTPPTLDAFSGKSAADRKKAERLAELAVAMGELVVIEPKMYLHRDQEGHLREEVAGLIQRDGPATVAEIREALGSSRKYVVPFVEYLDRIGFTRRVGDRREVTGDTAGVGE
ncbi:MAG: selenocysteine-specific translation elongation factor [Phycisphaerae bacterium]|nr:selenocysteine-specific translation elongation factor [Phycisphaerae bacterium]